MGYDKECITPQCFRNRTAVPPPYCRGGQCPQAPYWNEPQYPFYHMGYGYREMPHAYEPMPYYLSYPFSMRIQEDEEEEMDMDKVKDMFPEIGKLIQEFIEEECDKMEYDGSIMFDEYPDKLMIEKIVSTIYQMIPAENLPVEEEETEDEIFATNCPGCYRNRGSFMQDLITIMLFQEMHRRRCRHRRCKRWW